MHPTVPHGGCRGETAEQKPADFHGEFGQQNPDGQKDKQDDGDHDSASFIKCRLLFTDEISEKQPALCCCLIFVARKADMDNEKSA